MNTDKDHLKDMRFPHPALPLGTILREWSKDRDEAAIDVVRDIASGIYAGGLEQGVTWQQEDYDSGKILMAWASVYFDSTGNMTLRQRVIADKQIIGADGMLRSALWTEPHVEALKFLQSQIPSVEPQNLFALLDEFSVKREDFERWINYHKQHSLPCFWFGTVELQIPDGKDKDGQGLANKRHGKTAPSTAAVKQIAARIQIKEKEGDHWHQLTEIDQWLSENPDSTTTRDRLNEKVKIEIHPLPAKNGRPTKNK